ncbi:hypothetical protein [Bradyrhizobium sp. dw_411]|uniref:hypothetical protein n=1 Tax=Bradyrhizobium sp. dw_411 TaxID=2720082 RepID=UPI001BD05363|nr:hypothetical protein [Bradyrhizobium sp. dw_411]
MQQFLTDHLREIVSVVVPFIAWMLTRYFSSRPRLVRSTRHAFTYLINEPLHDAAGNLINPSQLVNVASLHIVNAGSLAAKNVEIVFNWQPQYFNVWPSRHYETKTAPDRRFSIIFANLPPKDVIGFELLSINAPLPEMVTVTSEQVTGTSRTLALQPVYPRWVHVSVFWLIFCGVGLNVFALISLLQTASK